MTNQSAHYWHPSAAFRRVQIGTLNKLLAMVLVGMSVAACVALVIVLDHQQSISGSQQQRVLAVTDFSRQVEFLIQANRQSLRQVRNEIRRLPAAGLDDISAHQDLFGHPVLHQQQLLVAPDLKVQAVFPANIPSGLLNHSLRDDPAIWPSLQIAIEQHNNLLVGLSNPQLNSSSEHLWLLLSPVYSTEQQLWGVIGAQLDYRQLLVDAGLNAVLRNHAVYVQSGSQLQQVNLSDAGSLDFLSVLANQSADSFILSSGDFQSIELPIPGWKLLLKERAIPLTIGQHVLLYGFLLIGIPLLAAFAYWFWRRTQAEHKSHSERLEFHQQNDDLTKLPNRELLISQLEQRIQQNKSTDNKAFALFYIDFDHFKEVNVLLGYTAGDEFLLQLSKRMRTFLTDDNLLARCGGDEFVMTVGEVDQEQAELIAADLLKCLGEPLQLHGHTLACSTSIGIAMYPQHSDDAASLVNYADRAMFQAKQAGRATHCVVDESRQDHSTQDLSLRKELELALQRDDFALSYQPIVNMQTGEVLKCEALLCWRDNQFKNNIGEHGIQVAEQGGLIREIGLWVLENACIDLQAMRARGHDVQIAVNRSSQEFLMPGASTRWLALLAKYQVAQHNIVFEITESLLMDEQDKTAQEIELLKKAGIDFSVDDFGTGYSAINYLRRFPVSYLKIDRSFVARMFDSAQDRVLVEIMVKLGDALNIKVVAEGVETERQYHALREMGCHYAQGYYVAKPMRLSQWIAFLDNHQPEFAMMPPRSQSQQMGLR